MGSSDDATEGNATEYTADADASSHSGAWFATCGGTGNGRPCKFPFMYKFKSYRACIMEDHHQPWCYVVGVGWGNCNCPRTCGGNGGGRPCKFPFEYLGSIYETCTARGHHQPWCYTEHGGWGNCN